MNLLTLVTLVAAALVNLYIVGIYVIGIQVSNWLGRTTPAPNDVGDRLSVTHPPILVVHVDTNFRSASAGPPWSRRVLVTERTLNHNELPAHVGLAVATFETYAYDIAIFTYLLRLDILLGILAVLSLSVQDQIRGSLVVGSIIAGVVGIYVLYRITVWRTSIADERAAARVGHDAVASILETAPEQPLPWFPDYLRPQPQPKHRLETLEAREDGIAA